MSMVEAPIVSRTDWAEGLWSIRLGAVVEPFAAGQFVNVSMRIGGERIKRSYSLASAPGEQAELLLVVVRRGALTPHLHPLGVGDTVEMTTGGSGFFTLDHVPDARDLWLVATGTGLAPYVAMLREGTLFDRFENVVVVHAVRLEQDLAYREEIERFARSRRVRYVPVVSRADVPGMLRGRVPALIAEGLLEEAADLALSPAHSHVMLCGNPDMIGDAVKALGERDMRKHRRRKPGHITFEKYW